MSTVVDVTADSATLRNVLSAISTVMTSVGTPLIVGPAPGRAMTAGIVASPDAVRKFEPGGPGILTCVAPAPFGMVTVCPPGRPEPTCRKSRTMRSIPVRKALFIAAICSTTSLDRTIFAMPASAPPTTSVRMPIEISNSISEKPADGAVCTLGVDCFIAIMSSYEYEETNETRRYSRQKLSTL
jgi:hypothetical protein